MAVGINPERVAAQPFRSWLGAAPPRRNPFRVGALPRIVSQGSSFLATLGWRTQSRWDWKWVYRVNNESQPKSMTPPEQADVLQRILDAVEQRDQRRWVEIGCAIVLSLATVASAWCAYQSALWGGVQTFRLAAVSKAGREIAVQSLAALQRRGMDATMFMNYLEAHGHGNTQHEAMLHQRGTAVVHELAQRGRVQRQHRASVGGIPQFSSPDCPVRAGVLAGLGRSELITQGGVDSEFLSNS